MNEVLLLVANAQNQRVEAVASQFRANRIAPPSVRAQLMVFQGDTESQKPYQATHHAAIHGQFDGAVLA